MMYQMLAGFPPFLGHTQKTIIDRIKKVNYSFRFRAFSEVSGEAKDLISRFLVKNPSERLTAKEALKHSWFKQKRSQTTEESQEIDHDEQRKIMESLRTYSINKVFAREAMNVIVNLFLPREKIVHLKNAFKALDEDQSGMITFEELRRGMHEAGFEVAGEELTAIMDKVDARRNGKINYTEFIAAVVDVQRDISDQALWAAFKHFDTDNSGYITFENIKQVMNRTAREISDEEVEDMIKEVDIAKDGRISFREFQLMLNIQETKCPQDDENDLNVEQNDTDEEDLEEFGEDGEFQHVR